MIISRLPSGGAGGGELHGASVVVTASDEFIGKDITLEYDGQIVDTQTLPASKAITFTDILDAGIYTAKATVSGTAYQASTEVTATMILEKGTASISLDVPSASILVTTEDATLHGQTVDLYFDGSVVDSGVFSTSGSCLFANIMTAGDYTAKCGDLESDVVTISADDIANNVTKSCEILREIKLTIEGAKEDTITITNGSWSETVVFGTGKVSEEVSLIIPPELIGTDFIFTSSIAKDTTSGTSNYSKTVLITRSTKSVKVMPEGLVLYWYGNKCEDVTGGYMYDKTAKRVGYAQTATPNILELDNTNDMVLGMTSASGGGGIRTKNEINIDGYSTINVVWGEKSYFTSPSSSTKQYGANANSAGFGTGTNGVQDPVNVDWYGAYPSGGIQPSSTPKINILTHQLSTQLRQCYASFMLGMAQTATVTYVTNPLALWLE